MSKFEDSPPPPKEEICVEWCSAGLKYIQTCNHYQFYITNKNYQFFITKLTETTWYIAQGCELGGLIVEDATSYMFRAYDIGG
jgi:hypothetical protein